MKKFRYKDSEGYIKIRIYPENPYFIMADRKGHVYEHRLFVAQYIKRPLDEKEVVHHINGRRDDNGIRNLHLFENVNEHQNHHRELKKIIMKLLNK